MDERTQAQGAAARWSLTGVCDLFGLEQLEVRRERIEIEPPDVVLFRWAITAQGGRHTFRAVDEDVVVAARRFVSVVGQWWAARNEPRRAP